MDEMDDVVEITPDAEEELEVEAAETPVADDAPEAPVGVEAAGGGVDRSLAAVELETFDGDAAATAHGDLSLVLDVPVELAVEIGRTTMTIRETLQIGPGSIISLDRLAGEPVDLLVNSKRIARGEVVAIDEEFGLRVTEVLGLNAASLAA